MIIDYKWTTYTRSYFVKQFLIFLLFVLAYFLDVNWIGLTADNDSDDTDTSADTTSRIFWLVILRAAGVLLIGFFFLKEIQSMIQEGWEYFSTFWNYSDLSLYVGYFLFVALAFTQTPTIVLQVLCSIIWLFGFAEA